MNSLETIQVIAITHYRSSYCVYMINDSLDSHTMKYEAMYRFLAKMTKLDTNRRLIKKYLDSIIPFIYLKEEDKIIKLDHNRNKVDLLQSTLKKSIKTEYKKIRDKRKSKKDIIINPFKKF